jgi:hypothetical protein
VTGTSGEVKDVLFEGLETTMIAKYVVGSVFRLRVVVGGVSRYILLALTITRTRRWNYQNAQFLPDGSKVQRESITSRLSVETSYLSKELCISTATA